MTQDVINRDLSERTAKAEVRIETIEEVQAMHAKAIEQLRSSLGNIENKIQGLTRAVYVGAVVMSGSNTDVVKKVLHYFLGL